jgi:hypothetical protein
MKDRVADAEAKPSLPAFCEEAGRRLLTKSTAIILRGPKPPPNRTSDDGANVRIVVVRRSPVYKGDDDGATSYVDSVESDHSSSNSASEETTNHSASMSSNDLESTVTHSTVDYRSDEARFPGSVSCVTISSPDTLNSSETRVNTGK